MHYKKILKQIVLNFILFAFSLASGCAIGPTLYNQTEANAADVVLRAKEARRYSNCQAHPHPTLSVNQGPYVDKTPILLAKKPSWLSNHIVIRGEELPFSYYARTITAGGGSHILTRYQVGLDQAAKVSLNYSGTVRGALDLLASKAGYVYNVNGNNVYWQAFLTKTFDIAFIPGSSDYLMGKSQGGGGAASNSQTGSNVVNAILDDSASAQYSSLKGSLSVWRDLEAGLKELLSPDGRVMVSEATTTVTIRDRPTNIDLVSKYISNLNHHLAKQVLVKVQVLEVTLESDYTYGINWNILQKAFDNTNYILKANFGTPIAIIPFSGVGNTPLYGLNSPTVNAATNPFGTGVTALINALTQQGKVSVVSEPRVVCLNNQVSALRIINQQGYLASVQNTTVAGVAGGSSTSAGTVTTQLTPGTLITGLTIYILPKIMGNKILMQVNADISNNSSLTTISSTTGATPSATSTSAAIQVPNVTQKQFNQRAVIGSGDTLILAGFRQVTNTARALQLWDSTLLGGKGAQQLNVETVILITPIVLSGCI